jgi:hypothetical protein
MQVIVPQCIQSVSGSDASVPPNITQPITAPSGKVEYIQMRDPLGKRGSLFLNSIVLAPPKTFAAWRGCNDSKTSINLLLHGKIALRLRPQSGRT